MRNCSGPETSTRSTKEEKDKIDSSSLPIRDLSMSVNKGMSSQISSLN